MLILCLIVNKLTMIGEIEGLLKGKQRVRSPSKYTTQLDGKGHMGQEGCTAFGLRGNDYPGHPAVAALSISQYD